MHGVSCVPGLVGAGSSRHAPLPPAHGAQPHALDVYFDDGSMVSLAAGSPDADRLLPPAQRRSWQRPGRRDEPGRAGAAAARPRLSGGRFPAALGPAQPLLPRQVPVRDRALAAGRARPRAGAAGAGARTGRRAAGRPRTGGGAAGRGDLHRDRIFPSFWCEERQRSTEPQTGWRAFSSPGSASAWSRMWSLRGGALLSAVDALREPPTSTFPLQFAWLTARRAAPRRSPQRASRFAPLFTTSVLGVGSAGRECLIFRLVKPIVDVRRGGRVPPLNPFRPRNDQEETG